MSMEFADKYTGGTLDGIPQWFFADPEKTPGNI